MFTITLTATSKPHIYFDRGWWMVARHPKSPWPAAAWDFTERLNRDKP